MRDALGIAMGWGGGAQLTSVDVRWRRDGDEEAILELSVTSVDLLGRAVRPRDEPVG